MAWIPLAAAAVNAAGSAMKGSPVAPAGPSRADQSGYQIFDASGWIVATGSSKASGSPSAIPWAWIIGGAALALLIWKRA